MNKDRYTTRRDSWLLALVALCGLSCCDVFAQDAVPVGTSKKIWDQAPHNAFTDLVRFNDRWFCVFREGKGHVSPDGALRVITSVDGEKWESAALITSDNSDLRDAKITVTPDGQLMLCGAEALHDKSRHTHQSLAWFSKDGRTWSEKHAIGDPDFWLWRVTWHKGTAYGIGYGCGPEKSVRLYASKDGKKFVTLVERLHDVGYPNESSIVFDGDTAYCLLRRDGQKNEPNTGLLGVSQAPYTKWDWKDLGTRIGGPHMTRLPDGRFVAAVRLYDKRPRTSLCWIDPQAGKQTEFLVLPSGGDTSYAGLVQHDGQVWISYYSSHEGKTSIYLSKLPLRTRRVLYNFDGDSCLSTKAGGKGPVAVTVDDVKRLIEEVAYEGSRVDTVLVCVNAQVMYYPTKVGTMRGMLSTAEERAKWPASEKQRFENLKTFFDSGVDPYAVMLAEAKRRGREALLTIRMNDDHGDDFLRTQFMVDHPDWRLGTERYRGKGAIDFGREEVLDYTFRLIEEAMRRYDCDGIELDFNRFPTFFKDGSTEERVSKMNSLVERVRKMVDAVGRERGRKLVLAVRVPSNYGRTPPTPETARAIGCDVAAWAKNGWVDFVAVSEFLFERGDLPIAAWKQAIPSVPVYGGIECTRGGGNKNLTFDEYRAAGKKLVDSSSDGVYLFNFFTSREGGANAYEPPFEVLKELGR